VLFCKDQREDATSSFGGVGSKKIMSGLGRMWKKNGIQKYVEESKKESVNYKANMDEWIKKQK
jgi:hypothetical protein